MTICTLGVDLGENSCSAAGLDTTGKVVLCRLMRPSTIPGFTAKLAPCVIAMEACYGAHHLGRLLAAQGHTVWLMSPEYVRPYVKAQKNDDRDAEAIAEAATRPTMRFVEMKTQDQLDVQSLHRVRSRLVGARTNLINQARAILMERGIVVPQGRQKFERALDAMLADTDRLPEGRIRRFMMETREEWKTLDDRIAALDMEFLELTRTDELARRLLTIPGIGSLNATALAAAVGDASTFERSRDLSAWLGLVPKQYTTGGKPKIRGISKRGNRYPRTLLIHGARAALPSLAKSETPLGSWLLGLLARCHYNTVTVALANKLARIAWVTLRRGDTFSIDRAAMPI